MPAPLRSSAVSAQSHVQHHHQGKTPQIAEDAPALRRLGTELPGRDIQHGPRRETQQPGHGGVQQGGRIKSQQAEERFHRARGRKADGYLAYFQSYSNTYGPAGKLRERYGQALAHPAVKGIIIATRPDCVDEEKLDLIASLPGIVILELGIESCYDRTLARVHRGHTFADTERAVRLAAERGIDTRGHLILGLPGETREMLLGACDRINDLPLTGVKLHQLQILKGTPMALEYEKHPEDFLMPDLLSYIELLAEMIGRFRADLRIDRIAAAVPPRFLAVSPWSGVRPDRIRVLLEKKLAEKGNPISPSPG